MARSLARMAVPALDANRVALLAKNNVTITAVEPLGARVSGIDFRSGQKPSPTVVAALQKEMANRGFLVFEGQGVLTAQQQIKASELWGGREIHSTHGVHPQAPDKHIFRLSNDPKYGILGVGPQWHNDGSFEVGVFSHVGYHIVRVPEKGGDTMFAHQGAAFDALPEESQERWQRLVSVNATTGVLHPLVHEHPISKRKSVYLHLGMTGAVLESLNDDPKTPETLDLLSDFRLLEQKEMTALFHEYHALLDKGLSSDYAISYPYREGDCIIIDNLAIAHRATPQAHAPASEQGLRILHRTTVKAMRPFLPPFGLPPALDITARCPFKKGVWVAGGVGFRWDPAMRLQN